jgi:hypothetical protein
LLDTLVDWQAVINNVLATNVLETNALENKELIVIIDLEHKGFICFAVLMDKATFNFFIFSILERRYILLTVICC